MALQNSGQLDVPHLNATQALGISQYGLTLPQVKFSNYGEHTLHGMQSLIDQQKVNNPREAFIMLQGMDSLQVYSVVVHDLSVRQVLGPHFNEKALSNMNLLRARDHNLSNRQAFSLQSQLNRSQLKGILFYNLSVAQVSQPNYGQHTLNGIEVFLERNTNSTPQDAIHILTGLNRPQINGIIAFGLSREQVHSQNFDYNTINAMKEIKKQRRVANWQQAFTTVEGLNQVQRKGVIDFRLERNDVLSSNFGKHTLEGIKALALKARYTLDLGFTFKKGFQMLKGLKDFQIKGILDYNLTREDVTHKQFTAMTLDTMRTLERYYGHINIRNLYNTAMQLPEYQARAINELKLDPKKLGLTRRNRRIIQIDKTDADIVSGFTVDAISHLMKNEKMDQKQAFKLARELNAIQVIGMIDFGLRIDQVQHELFKSSKGILDELFNIVNKVNEDLNLPLSAEDKESVRNILDFKISQESSVIFEKTKSEVKEFLDYASKSDVFGLFKGIRQPNQSSAIMATTQNLKPEVVATSALGIQEVSGFTTPVVRKGEGNSKSAKANRERKSAGGSTILKNNRERKVQRRRPGL